MKATILSTIVLVSLAICAGAAKPVAPPPVLKVPVCSFNKMSGLYKYETPAYNGWANGLNSNGQSCTIVPTPALPVGAPAVAQPCTGVPALTATNGPPSVCACTDPVMVGPTCECNTPTYTWTWTGDAATSCQPITPPATIPVGGRKMLKA